MAAPTRGSIEPSSDSHTSARISWVCARSAAGLNAARSGTQVGDFEDPVGRLVELLQSRLRTGQKCGRRAKLRNPFLEQGERRIEVELFVLESRGDRLETRHALL